MQRNREIFANCCNMHTDTFYIQLCVCMCVCKEGKQRARVWQTKGRIFLAIAQATV